MEAIGKATGVVPVAKEQDTEVDFVIIGAGTDMRHQAPCRGPGNCGNN